MIADVEIEWIKREVKHQELFTEYDGKKLSNDMLLSSTFIFYQHKSFSVLAVIWFLDICLYLSCDAWIDEESNSFRREMELEI